MTSPGRPPRRPDPFETYAAAFQDLLDHLPDREIGPNDRLHPSLDPRGRLVVRASTGAIYILLGMRLGPLGLDPLRPEPPGALKIIPDGQRLLFVQYSGREEVRRATVPRWIVKGAPVVELN